MNNPNCVKACENIFLRTIFGVQNSIRNKHTLTSSLSESCPKETYIIQVEPVSTDGVQDPQQQDDL